MYYEKEPQRLPFAVDETEARRLCAGYGVLFAVLLGLLIWLMANRPYAPEVKRLALVAYLVVALLTWLPMALRCFATLELTEEEVRIRVSGRTLRRYGAEKIRFLTAMECSGKNRTVNRSQILLCAHTLEELAAKGGWKRGESIKSKEELARLYLNRYATAYYVRELNLTGKILWLDWSPERLRLLRWMYPDAVWADFSHGNVYDRQLDGE